MKNNPEYLWPNLFGCENDEADIDLLLDFV